MHLILIINLMVCSFTVPRTEMVDIELFNNGTKVTFSVFKDLLCHYSNKMDQGSIDNTTKKIALQGFTETVVGLFNSWLYTQHVGFRNGRNEGYMVKNGWFLGLEEQAGMLGQLWILGHFLRAPTLQNSIIDELEHLRKEGFIVATQQFLNDIQYHPSRDRSPLQVWTKTMLYSVPESEAALGRLPPKADPSKEELETFYVEERVKRASDGYLFVGSEERDEESDEEGDEEEDEEGTGDEVVFGNEGLVSG